MTLLAAYAVPLSRYRNPEDVVMGTSLANRYPVETEALIGFFVNTLALRVQWQEGATYPRDSGLRSPRRGEWIRAPGRPLRPDCGGPAARPERPSQPSFPNAVRAGERTEAGARFTRASDHSHDLERSSAGATFDLTLTLKETAGELCGALEFNAALFDTATIERMAAHFQTLLAGIVQIPTWQRRTCR